MVGFFFNSVLDLEPSLVPGFAPSAPLFSPLSGHTPRLARAVARTGVLTALLGRMRLEEELDY